VSRGHGEKKGSIIIAYFLIAIFIIAFDQFTKYLAITTLTIGQSVPLIEGVFSITLVLNKGIAFGLLQNSFFIPEVIGVLAALGILIFFVRFCKNKKISVKISLMLILAGCIGNLVDRLRYNAVIDFLDFKVWPVFNVADSAICIGVCLLIFGLIKKAA